MTGIAVSKFNEVSLMDKQETLEITVSKSTAKELREAARKTGMTIGEIVDKIVDELELRIVPTNPKIATILAQQEAFHILSLAHLDYEDYQKAYFDLTAAIMAYYPPKAFSELAAEAKVQRKKAIEEKAVPNLTDEEVQDLLRLLPKFRSKKSRK